MNTYEDACPICWPGDQPATFPHTVEPDENNPGTMRAEYECDMWHEWVTWWDGEASGWPVSRKDAA